MHPLIGVGAGMFNLGLAALLDDAGVTDCLFLDKRDRFRWHDGISTDVSYYQDDHLSDLVTLANPRSRYTFLSYLKQNKLLYQFASRLQMPVLRAMWEAYFKWVADELGNVRWDHEVLHIDFKGDHFEIATAHGAFKAQHVSLGVGIEPFFPAALQGMPHPGIYHSAEYNRRRSKLGGKTVCVVGASQSGAEIVDDILGHFDIANLIWISSTPYHQSKDPALYLFDIWNPSIYRETFHLPEASRHMISAAMGSTQNSISAATMSSIYARLFDQKFYTRKGFDPVIICNNRVTALASDGDRIMVDSHDQSTGKRYRFVADEVILATGYTRSHTRLLQPLIDRYGFDPHDLCFNHSVKWQGSGRNEIFLRNNGIQRFGVMESNAFIQPYVSSLIVNAVLGQTFYDEMPDRSIQKYSADLSRFEI